MVKLDEATEKKSTHHYRSVTFHLMPNGLEIRSGRGTYNDDSNERSFLLGP
jgi:hypothetical protein